MFGKFTWQEKTNSGLNLSTGDCRALVVVSQPGGFGGDSFEYVVYKAVHDGHSFAGDARIGVHLFQNFVDVDTIGFPPPPFLFLVPTALSLSFSGGFLGSLGARGLLGRHYPVYYPTEVMRQLLDRAIYMERRD